MGRKCGSGQGSIFRQGKIWRGQIVLNGERRSVSGKTKKEVATKLAELRYKYDNNEYAKRSDLTFEKWRIQWLNEEASKTLSEESLFHVSKMFDRYVSKEINETMLQDLSRRKLEQLYEQRLSGLSSNTVRAFSVQMKRCLEAAVDSGILVSNPHDRVRMCKTRKPKKVFAYTSADQEKIVRQCKETHNGQHEIFYFLIGTGMRFGEAAALLWEDVDLETGAININKTTIHGIGGTVVKNSPKTDSGIRTIYVGDNVRIWLKGLYANATSEYVFPGKRGQAMPQSTAIRHWNELCDEINIQHQGMHALRHTWATRALEAGIDIKTVSNMLGHKNITTTMNTYQDVFDSQKIKAACTLNAQF